MEFYGTREKQRCDDQVEVKQKTIKRSTSTLLGADQFRCGRPNWYTILLDVISTAHHHPTGGCSSAIAHDLTVILLQKLQPSTIIRLNVSKEQDVTVN
jgi:hypothetical protein